MFSKSLFAVLAALAVNAQTISTPAAVIQCQPARFTVSGGEPPYIVDVIPGGQVSAPAIAFIGDDIQGPAFTWTPDLPAGSNITFRITDSTGSPQYSFPVVIQAGSSDACLNASASSVSTGAVTTTGDSSSTESNLPSQTVGGATTSAASSSASNSASSASNAASSAASSATGGVGASISSVSNGASSVVNGASSAVASATDAPNGAHPSAVAGAGALAAGVIGGLAMLF